MPHRTSADSLVTQAGTVGTFRPFAANHTGMILGGDPDATEPVVVVRQTGMVFGALFRI
ncbi:MAG: hypothetical protein KZQ65_02690 [Candidatus Thiodiazotropha sp. (ex Gloverina cf. vestifex)]|nr:hypothetical protein [Candidatus Thiodiazotropha sp. (ex Gloverina cf. vestifex)]